MSTYDYPFPGPGPHTFGGAYHLRWLRWAQQHTPRAPRPRVRRRTPAATLRTVAGAQVLTVHRPGDHGKRDRVTIASGAHR